MFQLDQPVEAAPIAQEEEEASFLNSITPQVRQFCQFYAINKSVVQCSALSGLTQEYISGRLLKRTDVQKAILYYETIYLNKYIYDREKLLRQWSAMASINLLEYMDDNYKLKPLSDLTAEQKEHLGMAIIGTDGGKGKGRKPKFAKVEAMINLGKLLHLYDNEKGGADGLTLNIHLGQQMNMPSGEDATEDLGPFRYHTPLGDTSL